MPRRAALFGLLALGGCGLTPVYGTNGNGTALRGAVSFTVPDTVAGYRLRERFIQRLGDTELARYSLSVALTQETSAATITLDGDTTRFNLIGSADYVLTDASGKTVLSDSVETFTSYSATGSTVATQAAQVDANARLSVALADLIVARLLLLSQ